MRNFVITTVLIVLNLAPIKTFSKNHTSSEPGDTTKMIAGVPLKAEDISPLQAGENIPQVKLASSTDSPGKFKTIGNKGETYLHTII